MTTRNVTIRLSVKDQEIVKRALMQLGADGQRALKRIESASAPASKGLLTLNAISKQTCQTFSVLHTEAQRLKIILLTGFAAIGGMQLFRGLLEANKSIEKYKANLETVTGSEEAAANELQRLLEFAKNTPFTLDKSIEAFIKLKALGLDPSERAMKSYGNTASAMGKDMVQMIEAVADASTGEMERLKEFGIKAKQEGDKVQFTFRGVTTEVGRNAKEIQDYLIKIGETDFAGAMDRQMSGLPGKLSNLEDSFFRLKMAIGEGGFTDAVSAAADELSKFISDFIDSGKAKNIGEVLGQSLRTAAEGGKVLLNVLSAISSAYQWLSANVVSPAFDYNNAVVMASEDMKSKYGDRFIMDADKSAEMDRLVDKYLTEIKNVRNQEQTSQNITLPPIVGTPEKEKTEITGVNEADSKALEEALKKLTDERKKIDDYYKRLGERLTLDFDPMARYITDLNELNETRNRGLITAEVHSKALLELNKQLRESYRDMLMETREWKNGTIVALSNIAEEHTDAAKNASTTWTNFFGNMQSGLTDVFDKAKYDLSSIKDLLEDVLNSLKRDLISSAVKQAITGPLASSLGKSLGGESFLFNFNGGSSYSKDYSSNNSGSSGGFMSGIGSFFSNIVGSLFGFGGFRADGGDVTPNNWYVVGEKRPEIFIPKQPGTIVPTNPAKKSNSDTRTTKTPNVIIENLVLPSVTNERTARRSARQVASETYYAAQEAWGGR